MTWVGMIIGVVLSVVLYYFFGPLGGLIFAAVVFGMIYSTHQRTKEIDSDIRLIKERLGLLDSEEQEELRVEQEVEDALENNPPSENQDAINEEIEAELEQYIDQSDTVDRENKK